MTSSAEQLAGRATGALFFALFGGAWLSFGLAATERLTAITGGGVGVGALALLLTSAWVLHRAKQLPTPPPSPEAAARRQRAGRLFNWINAAQWSAIFLLSWLLNRLGYGQVVVPMTVAVVGLHFLPLAHLFRYPGHYLTGAALLAWALGCLLLGRQPALQAQAALGAGIILWTSAGCALWLAIRRLRQG